MVGHIKDGLIEGTDGFRIHQYKLNQPLGLPDFLMPPLMGEAFGWLNPEYAVIELGSKEANGDMTSYVRFTDNITTVTWMVYPAYVGTYPDCNQIYPTKLKNVYECNVNDLLDGLGYLLKNKSSMLIKYNGDTKCFEQKSGEDINSYDIEMGDVSFGMNVKFLFEAVKYQFGDCETVNIGINGSKTPLVLTSFDSHARTALMPMQYD
jgi:hypothetical protein